MVIIAFTLTDFISTFPVSHRCDAVSRSWESCHATIIDRRSVRQRSNRTPIASVLSVYVCSVCLSATCYVPANIQPTFQKMPIDVIYL